MIVGAENYDRLFLGAFFSEVEDSILYVFARTEELAAEIELPAVRHFSAVYTGVPSRFRNGGAVGFANTRKVRGGVVVVIEIE